MGNTIACCDNGGNDASAKQVDYDNKTPDHQSIVKNKKEFDNTD